MIEAIVPAAKVAAKAAAGIGATVPAGIVGLMRRVHRSVGFAPPTVTMIAEERPATECALFRHLPQLSERIAWRSLGAARTPVHTCLIQRPDGEGGENPLKFTVKREDLISPLYGGNKVRTLQHQLATCESRREGGERAFRQLVSIGTGGSNQIVATVVHARGLGWVGADHGEGDETKDSPPQINVSWFDKDEPDLDNTLNMLSVLSFPSRGWTYNWGEPFKPARFVKALVNAIRQEEIVPMMPGGNCPAGVLGQVGGVLELAEQITAGECADLQRIYVPIGSACTISGLIIGTVLARRLGMDALSHPEFSIIGCHVHEGLALFDEKLGFHTNPLFGFVPLTITHTVKATCAALRGFGGPDLEADALKFLKTNVSIVGDQDNVGIYGAHSDKTRAAANLYDTAGRVEDLEGREAPPLWLCGHFAAKAFAPLLNDLEHAVKPGSGRYPSSPFMLWMTKSAVQPRGGSDEWEAMMQQNDTIKRWANEGKAESTLRRGRVSTTDGSSEDYRDIMTKI